MKVFSIGSPPMTPDQPRVEYAGIGTIDISRFLSFEIFFENCFASL